MPRVSFPSRGLSGVCADGESILEAVRALGYVMDHACGGNALCGTCCVRVVRGAPSLTPVGPDEADRLLDLGLAGTHRLACQARIQGDIVVAPAI
ncbi:MAG: (2Fe-2S)-binding protein [Acidobacteria bacterium]|nr:(2Fe-2S)-binding protein [Acidobacteriota bacterium]